MELIDAGQREIRKQWQKPSFDDDYGVGVCLEQLGSWLVLTSGAITALTWRAPPLAAAPPAGKRRLSSALFGFLPPHGPRHTLALQKRSGTQGPDLQQKAPQKQRSLPAACTLESRYPNPQLASPPCPRKAPSPRRPFQAPSPGTAAGRAGRRRDGDGAQSQAGPKPGLKRHLALARATPLFLREWRSRPVPSRGTIYWGKSGGWVVGAGRDRENRKPENNQRRPAESDLAAGLAPAPRSPEPEGGAMRSAPSRCAVARALVLAGLWLAAAGRPLAFSDAGPHVHYGWGESVRLRHLYTAGPQGLSSCFLRIHSDGAVDCAPVQSAHSLMEIRAVALSTVAIKGERSVLYLCMGADGKMQGLSQYSAEDCAFEEEIRPDGYNVYWSKKHHLPVSLSSARQRQLFKSRGFLPLSHFLPMLSTIPTEPDEIQDHLKPDLFALPLKTDSMDPFGLATKLGVVKSPSFYK
ncbi:PREDICTED: uncharacterized protein LOC103081170 [Lipotes vexillifer]|uniref:Fibroblast growth factor n=1 Tax=Lipotes vexillifer TaxID=118797 RepID=A0A340XY52_LIPVE|nr:PREDICTED: uncharacterized protein LOC103081170 [Lipotes vexillifer]